MTNDRPKPIKRLCRLFPAAASRTLNLHFHRHLRPASSRTCSRVDLHQPMRGTIGRRLPYCSSSFTSNASARQTVIPFSTSSGDGGGRGRGRGRGAPTLFDFTVPADDSSSSRSDFTAPAPGQPLPDDDLSPPGLGHGRGRGRPVPSSPTLPSYSSFLASLGQGRGRGQEPTPESDSKRPIFFRKDDGHLPQWASPPHGAGVSEPPSPEGDAEVKTRDLEIGAGMPSALSGAGRGKPFQQPGAEAPVEENRHLIERPADPNAGASLRYARRAVGVLSGGGPEGSNTAGRGGGRGIARGRGFEGHGGGRGFEGRGGGRVFEGRGGGRGFEGRGGGRGFEGRGRGRGAFGRGGRGGASRGRGGAGRGGFDSDREENSDEEDGLYAGDDADGEKFANKIGPEKMNTIAEAFEEIVDNVLPCPQTEHMLDALHTNCLIEFEPEYLMEEFGTNPDIDDKPPIPLEDALEKMKPFLMLYEGIQSQEEWEEAKKAAMDQVPMIKELLDYYSGPDRVTAKQQIGELERVAKTLPASAPASVKRFSDRAVLSLQSNPGWGWDKKCQFMDKLVMEVSQQYK